MVLALLTLRILRSHGAGETPGSLCQRQQWSTEANTESRQAQGDLSLNPGLDGLSVGLADWTPTSLASTGSTQLLDEHHFLQLGPILLSHGMF